MFNSTILEVVIGLVFLYLLFSLLATFVNEIIFTFFKFRAKHLKKAIKNMVDKKSDEGKELFNKFHKHPMVQSFLKRKGKGFPSYIEPKKFAKIIIEIYKEDKLLKATAEVKETIKKLPEDNYLRHILLTHIEKVEETVEEFKNDIQKQKEKLIELKNKLEKDIEDWFNSVMERTAGWYNRTSKVWSLIVALFIAIIFNFDSINVYQRLTKDSKVRKDLVKYAENNIDKYAEYVKIDTSDDRKDSFLIEKMDSLKRKINLIIDEEVTSVEEIAGIGWKLPEKVLFKAKYDSTQKLPTKNFVKHFVKKDTSYIRNDTIFLNYPNKKYKIDSSLYINSIKIKCELVKNSEERITSYTFSPLKYKSLYFIFHIWGFILTALAISLGAPFWFDVLNKVMKLRGTGKQQETPKNTTT